MPSITEMAVALSEELSIACISGHKSKYKTEVFSEFTTPCFAAWFFVRFPNFCGASVAASESKHAPSHGFGHAGALDSLAVPFTLLRFGLKPCLVIILLDNDEMKSFCSVLKD